MPGSNPVQQLHRSAARFVRRFHPKYAKRRKHLTGLDTQDVFTEIYEKKHWGANQSVSGSGSTPDATRLISGTLPELLQKLRVKVLLDAPCGDFSWMSKVRLDIEQYIGVDIVKPLIESHQREHADDNRCFLHRDLLRDPLPACDMIFCRDCMLHLSFEDQRKLLENFLRTECTYLMLSTYPETQTNNNIVTGEARPINLTRPPMALPAPIHMLRDEGATNFSRAMGVWTKEQLQHWSWSG